MSIHIEYIRQVSAWSLQKIINHYIQQEEQHVKYLNSIHPFFINDVTYEVIVSRGFEIRIRRVFISTYDSRNYSNLGWVITEDINSCMICDTPFQSFSINNASHHHCRGCGNIVCSKCSNSTAVVDLLDNLGTVRVCSLCYYGQNPVEVLLNYLPKQTIFRRDSLHSGKIVCIDQNLMKGGKAVKRTGESMAVKEKVVYHRASFSFAPHEKPMISHNNTTSHGISYPKLRKNTSSVATSTNPTPVPSTRHTFS
jgi:hypothetical protein